MFYFGTLLSFYSTPPFKIQPTAMLYHQEFSIPYSTKQLKTLYHQKNLHTPFNKALKNFISPQTSIPYSTKHLKTLYH